MARTYTPRQKAAHKRYRERLDVRRRNSDLRALRFGELNEAERRTVTNDSAEAIALSVEGYERWVNRVEVEYDLIAGEETLRTTGRFVSGERSLLDDVTAFNAEVVGGLVEGVEANRRHEFYTLVDAAREAVYISDAKAEAILDRFDDALAELTSLLDVLGYTVTRYDSGSRVTFGVASRRTRR